MADPSYNNCNPGSPVGLPPVPGPQDAQRWVAIIVTRQTRDGRWGPFGRIHWLFIHNRQHLLVLKTFWKLSLHMYAVNLPTIESDFRHADWAVSQLTMWDRETTLPMPCLQNTGCENSARMKIKTLQSNHFSHNGSSTNIPYNHFEQIEFRVLDK